MPKSDTKITIANILSDGEFHSGQALGELLGISRAAIANHIKSLSKLGLDIYSVTGRGYKLSNNLELLNADKIKQKISTAVNVEAFSIIDSTNEYLMNQIRTEQKLEDSHTVVAECQTDGRGRRGRKWQSPFGSHLYFSQYRVLEDGLAAAAGLSLAVGIAVQRTCQSFVDLKVELKWPNDVLVDGKKLAGVLIEAEGQSDGQCHLVIGVGINFDMPQKQADEIDQPWTDLKTLAHIKPDRNEFASIFIGQLSTVIDEYKLHRLHNLAKQWNELNAFADKEVEIISATKIKTGLCKGIDDTGALLLASCDDGSIERIFGGEVSLRKKADEKFVD